MLAGTFRNHETDILTRNFGGYITYSCITFKNKTFLGQMFEKKLVFLKNLWRKICVFDIFF